MQMKLFIAAALAVGSMACGGTNPTAPLLLETSVSAPSPTPTPSPSPAPTTPTPSPAPNPAPRVNRLTGVVQDALERPIQDAKVWVALGSSDDTDAEGRFAVTTSAPIGAHVKLMVYKEGYKLKEFFVTGPTVVITLYVRGDGDTSPDPDTPPPCVLFGDDC